MFFSKLYYSILDIPGISYIHLYTERDGKLFLKAQISCMHQELFQLPYNMHGIQPRGVHSVLNSGQDAITEIELDKQRL